MDLFVQVFYIPSQELVSDTTGIGIIYLTILTVSRPLSFN